MKDPSRGAHGATSHWAIRVAPWVALGLLGIVLELLVIHLTRVGGAQTTGDEPWYLIESQALWHLHPPILASAAEDFRNRTFSVFPPGTTIASPLVEGFRGPHGWVGYFEPGLPLILAPFFNLGGELIARAAFMTIEVAGLVFLHRRVSLLARLRRRSQIVLAIFFAAPALMVAATQIYPDLLAGVVLACAVIELAMMERNRRMTRFSTIVVALSVAILPWLQIKYLLVGLIVLVALLVVTRACRASWRLPVFLGVGVAATWLILLVYNVHYYGHALGTPERPLQFNRLSLSLALGLFFGREQGIFIQLPTALIGLTGLWLARRRLPIAVLATAGTLGVTLILNGAYTVNPFGGYSLSGRFEWTMMPALMAWSAWAISRWQVAGRSMRGPAVLVGGLWFLQAIPIVRKTHTYYNPFGLWDPKLSSGWWGTFDRLFPGFNEMGHPLGLPTTGLPVAVGLCGVVVVLSFRYGRPDSFRPWPALAVFSALAAALMILLFTVPSELPASALSFGPTALGAGQGTPLVVLQTIAPGTFKTTLSATLSPPPGSGTFTVWCQRSPGVRTASSARVLHPGPETTTLYLHCARPGAIAARLAVSPGSHVSVRSLHLWKVAT